ncbi:hypothetical protein HDU67_004911 [Dinochytrium kinnereticum]|nr:hypothetical protein HDU67_004911 [Dinochytrium kinnereticum]
MLPYALYSLLTGKKRPSASSATASQRHAVAADADDEYDESGDGDEVGGERQGGVSDVEVEQPGYQAPPPLPVEAFLSILSFTPNPLDVISLMLVCKQWSMGVAAAFYSSPPLRRYDVFGRFTALIVAPTGYHPYPDLVQRLDVGGPAAEEIEIGDLEAVLGLCQNLSCFKLTSCLHVSSILLQSLADFCPRLESLELRGCPIGDGFLPDLIRGCPNLRVLDLSETNVRVSACLILVGGLTWLERLSMDSLNSGETPGNDEIRGTGGGVMQSVGLQFLSLASGTPVTPNLIRAITSRAPSISRLNLSSSPDFITDEVIAAAVRGFPRLVHLEADWCPKITDVTLQTLAIHRSRSAVGTDVAPMWKLALSGSCVTPGGVRLLARECVGLMEVRLDGCARLVNSFVENIAVEGWMEGEAGKRAGKVKAGGGLGSPLMVKSRLPVARGRGSPSSSLSRVDSQGSTVMRPPLGWCRLSGERVVRRVAEFEP